MVRGLLLAHELGALPHAWLGGYRLERRYGLSHQTLAGWLGDHLKAAGVVLLLASGAALIVYLLERAADPATDRQADLLGDALRFASAAAALKCQGRGRRGCPSRLAVTEFLSRLGASR